MAAPEIARGKKWIERALRELAASLGIALTDLAWSPDSAAFTSGKYYLTITAAPKSSRVEILTKDIEDAPTTLSVQAHVALQLRQALMALR